MGMNWGAFAGAATTSALNTYERLGEEELRDMQRKELKERIAREAKEREIAAETFGKVGQDIEYGNSIATEGKTNAAQGKALSDQARTGDAAFDRAVAESAAGALRENAARQGVAGAEAPMKPMTAQKYSEDQAYADYARQMAGVDSRMARQARAEGMQIKDLVRKDKQAELVDQAGQEMRTFLQESKDFAEKNGLPAAVAKYGFGIPGVNIAVATGKDGQPVVNVLGKNNKVTQTIPLTMENYVNYIGQMAEKKFIDTLSSANPDYYFKGRQLRNEDRKTDIEEGFKGPGGVYERVQMADAAAKSKMYQARATPIGVTKSNQLIMSDGTTRPLPPGATAEDFFPKTSGIKNSWDAQELELVKQGRSRTEIRAERAAYFSERGYAPPEVQSIIESGVNPKTNKPFTDSEIAAYNKKYPNTPYTPKQSAAPTDAPAAAPSTALPTTTRPAYTPPADSKAGKAAQNRAAAQERSSAPSRAAQAEFAKDVEQLEPLALVQKYDAKRMLLSPEQLRKLKAAEQRL